MADLKVALQELKEESDSGTLHAAPALLQRPGRWRVWAVTLLAAFALGVGTLWLMRSPAKTPEAALDPISTHHISRVSGVAKLFTGRQPGGFCVEWRKTGQL